eukprot:scaffold235557_cov25-Tisochrysis_lutea.AAC.2
MEVDVQRVAVIIAHLLALRAAGVRTRGHRRRASGCSTCLAWPRVLRDAIPPVERGARRPAHLQCAAGGTCSR